jgi:D-alanyl-D-alanine carboxypeptidase (penicillin-binding protein 5/6)
VKGDIGSIPLSANVNAGILVDLGTRQVLWAKDAKDPLPIASMTKMMTSMIAYEDVLSARNGLTLNTQIPVTKAACKIGGSQVYLDPRESFTLSELLQAVSIKARTTPPT